MSDPLFVATTSPVGTAALKRVVRALGGGWVENGTGGYGLLTNGPDSVRVRLPDASDAALQDVSPRAVAAIVTAHRGGRADDMASWLADRLARYWHGEVHRARSARTAPSFTYFAGPAEDMVALADDPGSCALCGRDGACFDLSMSNLTEYDPDGEDLGCLACLRAGMFEFQHNLDVGSLDERGLWLFRWSAFGGVEAPSPPIPEPALWEMRHTPPFAAWQEHTWLTHCSDFMQYLGRWSPVDFIDRAPDGDGRGLFLQMTPWGDASVWDRAADTGHERLIEFGVTYYAFRCLHCGELRGYYDYP